MPVDWEDKYRRLHSQHGELKGLYAELQDHNKKLQTKIRKLEADFTALGGGAPPSTTAGPPKEDEDDAAAAAALLLFLVAGLPAKCCAASTAWRRRSACS